MDGSIQAANDSYSLLAVGDSQDKSTVRMAEEPLNTESKTNRITPVGVMQSVADKDKADSSTTQPLNMEQMQEIGQQLQDFLASLNKELEFSIDEESGQNVVRVYDQQTGDLIRQIPSEELLEVVARLSEAGGLFIKTEA